MPSCSRSVSVTSPAARRSHSTQSNFQSRQLFRSRRPSGFTLLEVLIATAVTLLMMLSLAQIFKVIGDSMRQGRAALELNNRLRSVVLRIRNDLENATAIVDPPTDPRSGTGYLKYYDGSLTDYSGALYSAELRKNDTTGLYKDADFSRYGDTDDVLMFTARAGDVWFTGKVPAFVLTGDIPSTTPLDDNTVLVTIASQHAEIIAFAEPLPSNIDNPSRSIVKLVADPADGYEKVPFVDANNVQLDLPVGYRLHYRTLLIRPDLNLANTGTLPFGTVGNIDYMTTGQIAGLTLPSPTCDMVNVHQQCDVSLRRVLQTAPGVPSPVAANSLEDLVNPANRFAHVQIPVLGTTSMPILALSPKINMPFTLSDAGSTSFGDPPTALEFQSGFLHPAFALFRSDRAGEDILASDILAFDVKGYDPGVPLLVMAGPDLVPGSAGDDDADGTPNNASEWGWAGSDDVIVSPNDPGYGLASAAPVAVGAGEYVDLGWARKVISHGGSVAPTSWSQLSGYSQTNFANAAGFPFTDALYKSGLVVQTSSVTSNPPLIYQPSYDTWTSAYEGDGILQAERLAPPAGRGVVQGSAPPPVESWRFGAVDAGTDGLDNFNASTGVSSPPGVDDSAELETSPPFPTKLRGLSITIRMEDPATRTVKQMSVAKEFVTQ